MPVTRFNINAELSKFLKGRKTKVDPASLLFLIGSRYLEMLQDRAGRRLVGAALQIEG